MKVFFDLIPVILFFIGFKVYGIFVATAIAIATTLVLIAYSKIKHGKVDNMLLANGVIISVLGGITLLLHDQTYIMWKPTVLYWLAAAVLLVSNQFFKKNFIRQMLENMFNSPEKIWNILNLIWVAFLIALGFLNLYVARHFTTDTWVNFKLFGVTSLLFIFMIAQALALKKYVVEQIEDTSPEDKGKQ